MFALGNNITIIFITNIAITIIFITNIAIEKKKSNYIFNLKIYYFLYKLFIKSFNNWKEN